MGIWLSWADTLRLCHAGDRCAICTVCPGHARRPIITVGTQPRADTPSSLPRRCTSSTDVAAVNVRLFALLSGHVHG